MHKATYNRRPIRTLPTLCAGAAGFAVCSGNTALITIRRRRFPIVGRGTGVWSFIHIDDAAQATPAVIGRSTRGIYNIVDDEPAARFGVATGAHRAR